MFNKEAFLGMTYKDILMLGTLLFVAYKVK